MTQKSAALALLAGACLAGCTSLPPMRSARSLEPGKSQGNLVIDSIDARYSKTSTDAAGKVSQDDGQYQQLGAVSGEYRGGTEVRGLELALGLGTLSSGYLDLKYQFLGHPWREGFAAALDGELDYFPFSAINDNGSQFSNGIGGSGGLIFGEFIGLGDFNVGARFGTLPQGTLYAYYTLFDVAGLQAPSDNYYEVNASLDFNLGRRVGLSLGGAYRAYVNKSYDYGSSSEDIKLGLPGFFVLALTANFGNQIPLDQNEPEPQPRRRRRAGRGRRDAADQDAADQLQAGKTLAEGGNYAEALTVFKGVEDSQGEDEPVETWIGYCYYHLKDWPHSLEYYRKALALDPDDPKLQDFVERLQKKSDDIKLPEDEDQAPLPAQGK
jgi:hypothetical protein